MPTGAGPAGKSKQKTRLRGPSGVQLGEDTARSRILQGAALVFAEQGARLASVQDILKASGISRRTFYRFYESKEGVMLALYELGTASLLSACKLAVASTEDPVLRFERCVDAHLRNAAVLSRLVFVLGGEAQRYESPLHLRRMQLHDQLVQLLAHAPGMPELDELEVRTMILALEGVVRFTLQTGDEGRAVPERSLARTKHVMMRLCRGSLQAVYAESAGLGLPLR
jgi:AcrR family transcriptional regulator